MTPQTTIWSKLKWILTSLCALSFFLLLSLPAISKVFSRDVMDSINEFLPLTFKVLILPTALAWFIDASTNRRRRDVERARAANHCPVCQYDRHGLSLDAPCPECNAPGPGTPPPPPPPAAKPIWFICSLLAAGLMLILMTALCEHDEFGIPSGVASTFFRIMTLAILAGGNILTFRPQQTSRVLLIFTAIIAAVVLLFLMELLLWVARALSA